MEILVEFFNLHIFLWFSIFKLSKSNLMLLYMGQVKLITFGAGVNDCGKHGALIIYFVKHLVDFAAVCILLMLNYFFMKIHIDLASWGSRMTKEIPRLKSVIHLDFH